MRLKKLMSLVLACAMALSLVTVASAADTKVYYAEDFSDYTDVAEFNATYAVNKNDVSMGVSSTALAAAFALRSTTNGAVLATGSSKSYGGGINYGASAFVTNSFGSKTYRLSTPTVQNGRFNGPGWKNNGTSMLAIFPEEAWDFVGNPDETYIVSYEIDADLPLVSDTDENRWGGGTVWTDANETAATAQYNLWSQITPMEGREPEEGETANGYDGKVYEIPEDYKYTYGFTTGSAYYNHTDLKFKNGEAHRIAIAHKYLATNMDGGKTYYIPVKTYTVDGAGFKVGTSDSLKVTTALPGASHSTNTKIAGFWHADMETMNYGFANIKIYTIKNDSFRAYIEDNTDVPLSQKTVRVKFSNPVAPATFSNAVVVRKDGTVMDTGDYRVGALKHYVGAVNGETYSYVDVTFTNLEEATTYTIEFASTIGNEVATTLGEKNVATFTTKYPDVNVNSLTIVGAESLVADGSLQATKLELANTTAENRAVAVIYAVYASNGQLADVAYVNDSIAGGKTAEIEAGMKLSTVGTLKTFVWNTMEAIKPYTGAQELAITAAAAAE